MWPKESTTPSRARMRFAVTRSSIRSSSLAIGFLTHSHERTCSSKTGSIPSHRAWDQATALLNFSCGTLKHIVSFARGQAMAENPVLVCAAADLPPGNVKSFEVGGELVAV